ncbi:MAG: ornithine carbamoyltransferase [Spirochaetota bacterium]
MHRSILTIGELGAGELLRLIDLSLDLKARPEKYAGRLAGRRLLLLFQKSSTRTRAAFELGMKALGGHTVVMDWDRSNLAISPIRHEAAFLSRVFDCVTARLVRHRDMEELARSLDVPSINGCCDRYHPSQVLADLMTVREVRGDLDTVIGYVGVHNNVTNSLVLACTALGIRLVLVTPVSDPVPPDVARLLEEAGPGGPGSLIHRTLDLEEAAARCAFLYTDTWVNMEKFGDAAYREERVGAMLPYQVNRGLVEGRDLYIMHDMPVHPGYEIDEYCVTCDRSLIYRQAENRLYTAQALLLALLEGGDG